METATKYTPNSGSVRSRRILLTAPRTDGDIVFGWPFFGPDYFNVNIREMKKPHTLFNGHAIEYSFREPTTSESIVAVSYCLESQKRGMLRDIFGNTSVRNIFYPTWLQAGRYVTTGEGIYVNPPLYLDDLDGMTPLLDESVLRKLRDSGERVKDIFFNDNDFAFVPWNSFEVGFQTHDTFLAGGLARALEHARGDRADRLATIANIKLYSRGVYVGNLAPSCNPAPGVFDFATSRSVKSRLSISGCWGNEGNGCAFGVLDSGEALAH